MENPKTSSHEGQNRNSQEVPKGDKFDTAGLVYKPCRLELHEKTKEPHIVDNTLQDIIDELLSRAVIWLLGYDARKPLDKQIVQDPEARIRAQAEGSHWETAWCIIHFLDARSILADRYPAIVREIDRRLGSDKSGVNPLAWLLAPTEIIDLGEEHVYWYGKEYDTAVVTLALLRARAERDLKLPSELKTDLDKELPKALRWLYKQLDNVLKTGKVDEEAVTVLEPFLYTYEHFAALPSQIWSEVYPSRHEGFYDLLDQWLLYLEAHAPHKGSLLNNYAYSTNTADCLCRVISTSQYAAMPIREYFRPLAKRAKILLLDYIEFLEEGLLRDRWGGTLNEVRQLSVYVEACTLIERMSLTRSDPAETHIASVEVILKVLSLVKNMFFLNGSMYHSVYPTAYFLRSLISIWNWPDSEKTIILLYHDLLDRSVVGPSGEREDNFKLRKSLVEHEHTLSQEKQRYSRLLEHYRWLRRGFIGVLAFLASAFLVSWAMPFLHFGHLDLLNLRINPGSGEGFITLIVTCAGLAGSVGYVIDRLWSRLEQ